MPMMSGSTPQTRPETMRAIGVSPAFAAASADATITAAAPSLLLLAERQAPTRAADHVRGHRHVLGASGEDEVGLAELDLLRAEEDRLEARSAEPVDREGGRLLRRTGLEADVPREVHRVAARLK